MTEDTDGTARKTRSTIDERLAAVRLEEAKLHAAKRAKRTHGLIKIGGSIVADAGTNVGIQDWLHRLWLKTELRDREAIEIASSPLDLTKPRERVVPAQQPSETSEPKTMLDNLEATNKTSATQVAASYATSSPQNLLLQQAATTTSDITKKDVDYKESSETPARATLASQGASCTGPSHQGFQPHQNIRPSLASVMTSNEKLPDHAAPVANRTALPAVATRPHFQSQQLVSPTKTEPSNTAGVKRAPNMPPAGGTPVNKTTSSPVVSSTVTGTET